MDFLAAFEKMWQNVGSYYYCGWRPARVKEAINENIFWLQWAFSRLYAKISCNAMVILHFKIFFLKHSFYHIPEVPKAKEVESEKNIPFLNSKKSSFFVSFPFSQ